MGGGYLLIILVLLVITNGITYGASQLTSDGVSYTRGSNTMSVKQALDDLMSKSSKVDDLEKKANELEEKSKVYKYAKLADVVKQGDYVAYNAGTWDSSVKLPTTQGNFGGYTASTSKNASVVCESGWGSTNLKGWRVLKVVSNQVYLVHAGQPECYYHGINSSDSLTKLDLRAQNTYVDGKYAESAHAMTYQEAFDITGSENTTTKDLRKTDARYWLAAAVNSTDLRTVDPSGNISKSGGYAHGFRPVVVLKSTVFTTGQGQDQFSQPAWILV